MFNHNKPNLPAQEPEGWREYPVEELMQPKVRIEEQKKVQVAAGEFQDS